MGEHDILPCVYDIIDPYVCEKKDKKGSVLKTVYKVGGCISYLLHNLYYTVMEMNDAW